MQVHKGAADPGQAPAVALCARQQLRQVLRPNDALFLLLDEEVVELLQILRRSTAGSARTGAIAQLLRQLALVRTPESQSRTSFSVSMNDSSAGVRASLAACGQHGLGAFLW